MFTKILAHGFWSGIGEDNLVGVWMNIETEISLSSYELCCKWQNMEDMTEEQLKAAQKYIRPDSTNGRTLASKLDKFQKV